MIKLTLTSEVLKDEIDKRINDLEKGTVKEKTDEDGNTAEWYRDMGMRVPKFLAEEEDIDVDSVIKTLLDDDKNFMKLESITYIKASKIDMIVDAFKDTNTTIFSGRKSFNVKESADEVYALIEQKLNKQ